jgi:hypothetical protein
VLVPFSLRLPADEERQFAPLPLAIDVDEPDRVEPIQLTLHIQQLVRRIFRTMFNSDCRQEFVVKGGSRRVNMFKVRKHASRPERGEHTSPISWRFRSWVRWWIAKLDTTASNVPSEPGSGTSILCSTIAIVASSANRACNRCSIGFEKSNATASVVGPSELYKIEESAVTAAKIEDAPKWPREKLQ